jgi:hypothetical protein
MLVGKRKSRVPDTFQVGAISEFSDFPASRFFYKLRVFNTREYSGSPRLHHSYSLLFCGFFIGFCGALSATVHKYAYDFLTSRDVEGTKTLKISEVPRKEQK